MEFLWAAASQPSAETIGSIHGPVRMGARTYFGFARHSVKMKRKIQTKATRLLSTSHAPGILEGCFVIANGSFS
jgi:hypothetical protein